MHEDIFSIWGKYVTHMKFRGISSKFTYIDQCDLINTCFELLHVWYIPERQCA